MTATNPRDRETVRKLLRTHLPSGFPTELGPLTIGDVACRLHNERGMGRLPMLRVDVPVNDRLLTDKTPLTGELSGRCIQKIREEHEIVGGSRLYWLDFQQAAIVMLMARSGGRAVVIACERRSAACDADDHRACLGATFRDRPFCTCECHA